MVENVNTKISKKYIFSILNISYLLGLIICFICNLAIEHTLSWFLIVMVAIAISFTITSYPIYLKINKYRGLKITTLLTILIYLLLATIHYVTGGDWLINSYKIATVELSLLWVTILIWTFTNFNYFYKISLSLFILAVSIIITNPICEKIFDISRQESNTYNVICAIIIGIIGITMIIKGKYKN